MSRTIRHSEPPPDTGASFNPFSTDDRTYQHRGPPLGTGASSRHRASSKTLSTEYLPAQRVSSRHRGLLSAAQGPPLDGTGPLLGGAGASSRHSEPPPDTGASLNPFNKGDLPTQTASSRDRSLLPTQSLLQSSQHRIPSGTEGLLSAQGPSLGGTGPPLSGTRASSRYRGLPQSPQHRGVGPFGTVSLLPTQGLLKSFQHRGQDLPA